MIVKFPSNVLVVGASGFIGSHLIRRLAQKGCTVEAWSRSTVEPPVEAVGRFVHRRVDLVADDPLPTPLHGAWDTVYQLAGESRPSRFVGQQHLRETVRMAGRVVAHVASVAPGCRYFLNSSAYVYSTSTEPCDEDHPTEPTGPYGLAKLLAEDVTQEHRHRLHVTIIRPFNLIGPGLPQGLFASDLLTQLSSGAGPITLATPDTARDLLDIQAAIDAYFALLTSEYDSGRVFNICSGRAIHASEFAAAVLGQLGRTCEVRFTGTAGPPLLGSCDRLRSETQWAPNLELADVIRNYVEDSGLASSRE